MFWPTSMKLFTDADAVRKSGEPVADLDRPRPQAENAGTG
jgi:hypothetical protein